MPSTEIRINDVPLDASGQVSWGTVLGFGPFVTRITADREFLDTLAYAEEVELKYVYGGLEKTWRRLYVMGEMNTVDKHRKTVVLADQRIWWKRLWFFRRYNIRTRSGTRRRLDADGEIAEEIAVTVDDVTWKKFSLRDGETPWTPAYVIDDFFTWLAEETDSTYLPGGNAGAPDRKPVDNLEIDDNAEAAAARVCAYAPGILPAITPEGAITLVNTLDLEASRKTLEECGHEIFQSGHPIRTEQEDIRPAKIRVHLSREHELRIDCLDPTATIAADEPFAVNVCPIPDPSLEVDGETLTQGTYVPFTRILKAWNADKGGANLPDITDEVIRQNWGISYLTRIYGEIGKTAASVVWLKRAEAIYQHYRQTWKVNRLYMDAIHSMRPYRVALLDPETGSFAASAVYADWSIAYSEKGLFAQDGDLAVMRSIPGGVGPGEDLADGQIAPCRLNIVDERLGIVRFDFATDLYGHVKHVIPSQMEKVASLDPDDWAENGYFTDGTRNGNGIGFDLSAEYSAAFVVTVAPGSPNSTEQLHVIEVESSSDDLKDYLPATVGDVSGSGPDWDLRIGPQIATARFAWKQSAKSEILAFIGVTGDSEPLPEETEQDLLQNPEELESLAIATSAALLAPMADHYVGAKSVSFNPDVEIGGNIASIIHTFSPSDMSVTTTVTAFEEIRPIDPMSMLPQSARRLFLREVQP